jgi:hypothetical protein
MARDGHLRSLTSPSEEALQMNQQRRKWMAVCALVAMFGGQLSTVRVNAEHEHGDDDDRGRGESNKEDEEHEGPRTATPIKHVIVLIV